MDRKTASSFAEWKRDPEHGILLVRGGRRVGKTYSIMRFVKKSYRSYAYFDLETDVRARDVMTDPDPRGGVLDRLLYGTPRMATGSAVVIEGIHLIGSPRASLQSIVLDGRFDVILSGSISEDDPGIPGCQVSVIEMRGLDFEEFLWATGFSRRHTEYLRECVNDLKPRTGTSSKTFPIGTGNTSPSEGCRKPSGPTRAPATTPRRLPS
ncbi:MAG: AAA family ATPase [Candidatus Methanomethylophilaceae archaeon]|nr:AAA family ATPase [Candidatus Methanomethylophilaceae archaeon]